MLVVSDEGETVVWWVTLPPLLFPPFMHHVCVCVCVISRICKALLAPVRWERRGTVSRVFLFLFFSFLTLPLLPRLGSNTMNATGF